MNPSFTRSLTKLALVSTALPVIAGNWPAWRGPTGTGVSSEKNLPLKWNSTEGVRWRVDLPDRGNSSPIVWADRVFVTQAVSRDNRRTLMCFDRANGKLLWQSGVTYPDREPTQRDNPYCSATPVTDGERVIASFGSAGLYCYDFAGQELWHRDFGKMEHVFGNAASPMLAGDRCILNFGPDEKARLIAVNKRTGETAWEAQPPKVEISDQPRGGGGLGGTEAGGPAGGGRGRPGSGGGPGGGGGPGSGIGAGSGGPGGRGGGGFGPGNMVAAQMLTAADKNADQKLTKEEFSSAAEAWFDKLDPTKTGKLDQQTFGERFGEVLPPAPGSRSRDGSAAPADGQRLGGDRREDQQPGGRRGGFSRERFIAPGLFAAADANKDAALTREEWTTAFARWFTDWDTNKVGALDETKLRDGLNAALPRPQFGGPGGSGGAPRGAPGGPGGGRGPGGPGGGGASWSTPILISAEGREDLIVSLPGSLVAYDPKSGKQLWFSKGIGGTIYTSPVWGEGTLIAMSSGPGGGGAIAVKPGGSGDVTESQRVWRLERVKSGIGSGVIHEGHLYTISQEGIAACMGLKNGTTVWEERLKGSGSRGSAWSSMLLADGKIYVPNQTGEVFVLRAGPKFEVLATNALNESTNASLAVAGGEIFLRTAKALWCIAAAK